MDEEISLLDILKMLKKNILLLFCFFTVGFATSIVYAIFGIEDKYSATTSMLVVISNNNQSGIDNENFNIIINTIKELPNQAIILNKVAIKNNLKVEDVMDMITVDNPSSSLFLNVNCIANDKKMARNIANDVVDTLIEECNNGNLVMIENELLITSRALEGQYVGKNKLFYIIAITIAILAIGMVIIIIKESVKKIEFRW